MKHKTHKIVSINILYFLLIIANLFHRFSNFSLKNFSYYIVPTTFLTLKFSILPDYIEGQERKSHRTWAHSLNILTLIILILFFLKYSIVSNFYQNYFENLNSTCRIYLYNFINFNSYRLGKSSSTRLFYR
jgi:hypothetical protein